MKINLKQEVDRALVDSNSTNRQMMGALANGHGKFNMFVSVQPHESVHVVLIHS